MCWTRIDSRGWVFEKCLSWLRRLKRFRKLRWSRLLRISRWLRWFRKLRQYYWDIREDWDDVFRSRDGHHHVAGQPQQLYEPLDLPLLQRPLSSPAGALPSALRLDQSAWRWAWRAGQRHPIVLSRRRQAVTLDDARYVGSFEIRIDDIRNAADVK